jgi:hypothetical protein
VVLGGAVALLAFVLRATRADPAPMTLRHRSDWWRSMLAGLPTE